MQADESLVAHITSTYYNISPVLGSIKQLHGYYDLNFLLTDSSSNKTYILKIVNQHDSSRELTDIVDTVLDNAHEYCQAKRTSVSGQHFLVPRLIRTIDGKLSTFTHMKYRDVSSSTSIDDTTSDASEEEVECNIKLSEFFAGQSMFDYMNECKKSMKLEPAQYNRLYFNLGRVCNQLFVFLQTQQRSLVDKLEEIRSRSYSTNSWLLKADEQFIRKHLDHIYPNDDDDDNNSRRQLVDNVLKEYATITRPKLAQLDEYIVHSDLNLTNMLAPPYDCNKSIHDPDNLEICLIDFQDIQTGYQMTDFATLILYSVLGHAFGDLTESLVKIPRYIYTGYHSDGTEFPMDVSQLKLVPSLIKYQLCKTLLNLEMADSHEEEYSYATHVIRQGWPLLEIMCSHSEYSNSDQLVSLWTRASE